MSRTGVDTWAVQVPRQEQDPVPVRIRVHGEVVTVQVGGSTRRLLFDVRLLAELVVDLKAAGRALRSNQAAAYVGQIGRERHGPPSLWAPILTPDEIERLDR